ncbi:hypothetical protein GDO78_005208 [Eleutherodactylus coqui]|uniref:Uncharacterized protein n=1 Tax=Eleutherodactylus coqui TaxID=57060 RepID=A0A8J6KHD5_ELECQ|nr:hypothetical protein GDO78_005208 [Eleutherodactylus coqui]
MPHSPACILICTCKQKNKSGSKIQKRCKPSLYIFFFVNSIHILFFFLHTVDTFSRCFCFLVSCCHIALGTAFVFMLFDG